MFASRNIHDLDLLPRALKQHGAALTTPALALVSLLFLFLLIPHAFVALDIVPLFIFVSILP